MFLRKICGNSPRRYSSIGLPLLTVGLGLNCISIFLNRRSNAGSPIPGEFFGMPVDDLVVITLSLISAIAIGVSIFFNVSFILARKHEADRDR